MQIVKKYQYELAILTVLLIQFLSEFVGGIATYSYVNYFMDYSYGFGPRKLIGALCHYLLPNNYCEIHLVMFVMCIDALLMCLVSFMLSKFIRFCVKNSDGLYIFSILFVALYLLCPARPEYLFVYPNFGRMDTFILIFALLFVMTLKVQDRLFYIISTLLMIASCLIHQIFVCIFLPLYCAVYIYRIFLSSSRKVTIIYSVTSMVILTGLFLIVHFFPQHVYELDDVVSRLRTQTGRNLETDVIFYEYYAGMDVHFRELILPSARRLVAGFFSTIVVLSPMIYILVFLWRNAAKISGNKEYRLTVFLMNLAFIVCIPAFVLTLDYGRWFSAIIICQFLLVGVMIYNGDGNMIKSALLLINKARDNKFLACMILVYIGSVGCFVDCKYLPCIERVFSIIRIG